MKNKVETDSSIQSISRWLPEGKGIGPRVKNVKGNKRHKFSVTNSVINEDTMYSLGDVVNNIIVPLHSVR